MRPLHTGLADECGTVGVNALGRAANPPSSGPGGRGLGSPTVGVPRDPYDETDLYTENYPYISIRDRRPRVSAAAVLSVLIIAMLLLPAVTWLCRWLAAVIA